MGAARDDGAVGLSTEFIRQPLSYVTKLLSPGGSLVPGDRSRLQSELYEAHKVALLRGPHLHVESRMNRIDRLLRDQITADLRSGKTPRQSLDRINLLLKWLAAGPLTRDEETQVNDLLARRRQRYDGTLGR